MSLNQLFRNAQRNASLKKAAAVLLTAGAVGFALAPASKSDNSAESSGAVVAFAKTNLVVPPPGSSAANPEMNKCLQNPTAENCKDGALSEGDWDQFLPPEGIVVRDGRGNVIFKKCRSLTEGAKAAKTDMEQERARFNKFNTAMTTYDGSYRSLGNNNIQYLGCNVKSKKKAPVEAPCPSLKNYTELKDFYRQQYYEMSNELQSLAKSRYECQAVRDQVMAATDPNWKNDLALKNASKGALSNPGAQ